MELEASYEDEPFSAGVDMRKKLIAILLFLAAFCFALPSLPRFTRNSGNLIPFDCIGEYHVAEVNGVLIFFEEAGDGKPVILLHGNGGSHRDLSTTISQMVDAGYKVYAVDSRGQGSNEPVPDYHYSDMADDVYELIRKWQLSKPALYGWSDGGIIGLLTEINHPGSLGLLAVSGANITPYGLKGFYSASISASNIIHPQSLTEMILHEPNITREELGTIRIPVLVTAGADDMIKTDHTETMAEAIPNAELIIFEDETHGSYILGSEKIGNELIRFFEENQY